MTSMTLGPLGEIKSLDQGIAAVYVMRLDFTTGGGETGSPEAFIFPVLKRKNGILRAVPLDFIPDESLDGGNFSAMEDLIGPSSSDRGDGWDRACPGLRDSVGGFLQSQSRCPAGSELSTCSSSTLGRGGRRQGQVLFSCRGGGVDGSANSSNKAEEAKGSGGPQKSDHSSSCRTTSCCPRGTAQYHRRRTSPSASSAALCACSCERDVRSQAQVTDILAQQSLALTNLVAHLASQDGYPDLGTSTSSSLSMRGTVKREKLMNDLASRKGDFFLKVNQNAFRRLRPTEAVPTSLHAFLKKGVFTKYLDRQGGYVGHRDQGLIMWLLAFVADQMMAEDYVGAPEHLALAMVAIEQAVQDGMKWDVAWLLSLQEDPPPSLGLFASRPTSTNPRLRAFAPLCPQEWATGDVKEVDLISSRRQESLHPKGQGNQQGPPNEEDGGQGCLEEEASIPKEAQARAEETTS